MERLIKVISVVLFLITVPLYGQSVEDIVNKHVETMGGLKAMLDIKTIKKDMMVVQDTMNIPVSMTFKRPAMVYIELTFDGFTQRTAYDGKEGWIFNPISGQPSVEKLSDQQNHDMHQQADFDWKLVNYKLKGSQVELLGEESEEGSKVYKIKLTDKFSEVTYYFIDTSSFLFLKEISQRIVTGEAYDVETSYEDYKKVDKVMFAHSIKELNLTDRTRKVEIVTIKIEINPPVADVLFSMPK